MKSAFVQEIENKTDLPIVPKAVTVMKVHHYQIDVLNKASQVF